MLKKLFAFIAITFIGITSFVFDNTKTVNASAAIFVYDFQTNFNSYNNGWTNSYTAREISSDSFNSTAPKVIFSLSNASQQINPANISDMPVVYNSNSAGAKVTVTLAETEGTIAGIKIETKQWDNNQNVITLYHSNGTELDSGATYESGVTNSYLAPIDFTNINPETKSVYFTSLGGSNTRYGLQKITLVINYEDNEVKQLETPTISQYDANYIYSGINYSVKSSEIANADSYEFMYYTLADVYVKSEISSKYSTHLNDFTGIEPGIYRVRVRALDSTGEYAPSEPSSNYLQLNINQPVIKNGITLKNLTPTMKDGTQWKNGGTQVVAPLDGYDTAGYYQNIYSTQSGNYPSNLGMNYTANKTLGAGTYYFSVNYKFNEEVSTQFNYFQVHFEGLEYYNGVPVWFDNPFDFEVLENGMPVDTYHREGRLSGVFTLKKSCLLSKISIKYGSQILDQDVFISHSYTDFMLINISESYLNDLNLPSKEAIDNFVDNFGYIDNITINDNYIFGPSRIYTQSTVTLASHQILSYYKALTGATLVIYENNYSLNQNKPGVYPVVIGYMDSFGTKRTRTIEVVVTDNEAPVIEIIGGGSTIISYVSAPLSIAEIIDRLLVTDNADGNLKSALTYDANFYIQNKNKPGVYPINFSVSDSSGNSCFKTINIQVVNDLGPTITAPSVIYKSEEIIFNRNDIIKTISSVVDQGGNTIPVFNSEGVLNSENFTIVQDTYTGKADVAGVYVIKVKASDSMSRVSFHTFTINVLKNIPNLIFFNNTIHVSFDLKLTNDKILELANQFNLTTRNKSNSVVSFVVNEYEDNNYAAGQSYMVRIRYVSADGTEDNITLTIKVSETPTQFIKKTSWWESALSAVFSLWWVYLLILIAFCGVGVMANRKPRRRRAH